jgi:hypothetical protein
MFCVLDVLGFRHFCFGHILDVLGLDVLGLDVLVLDVLGEHGSVHPLMGSFWDERN